MFTGQENSEKVTQITWEGRKIGSVLLAEGTSRRGTKNRKTERSRP